LGVLAGMALGEDVSLTGCYRDPRTGQMVCPLRGRQMIEQPYASCQQQIAPLPSRCRISCGDGSTGTATLIGPGLVLTCSHMFDQVRSPIVCVFSDGRQFAGTLIDRDPMNDLAAVRIQDPGIQPMAVNANEPSGMLMAGGFGGDGRFVVVQGQIVSRRETPQGASSPSAIMSGQVRPGDSGGAVVNMSRELVGIIWGARDNQTYFTCGRPLAEFLGKLQGGSIAANTPAARPQIPVPAVPVATAPTSAPAVAPQPPTALPPATTPPSPPDVPPLNVSTTPGPTPAAPSTTPPAVTTPTATPPSVYLPQPSILDRVCETAIGRALVLVGIGSGPAAAIAVPLWYAARFLIRKLRRPQGSGQASGAQEGTDPSVVTFHT
jgi:hypothetical protein